MAQAGASARGSLWVGALELEWQLALESEWQLALELALESRLGSPLPLEQAWLSVTAWVSGCPEAALWAP